MFKFLMKQVSTLATCSFTASTVPRAAQVRTQWGPADRMGVWLRPRQISELISMAQTELYGTRQPPKCQCVCVFFLLIEQTPCCVALLIIQQLQEHKTLKTSEMLTELFSNIHAHLLKCQKVATAGFFAKTATMARFKTNFWQRHGSDLLPSLTTQSFGPT